MITNELIKISPYAIPGIAKPAIPSPEQIISVIGEVTGLTPEEITWRSQKMSIIRARMLAMHFIKIHHPYLSLTMIGSYFKGRNGVKDHATVLNAFNRVDDYLCTDKSFVELRDKIMLKLNS